MKTIKRQSILPRIDGIQRDVEKLRVLGRLPFDEFQKETNVVLAQFYLRQALEGVFHIGSHLLSRLPGQRSTEYKETALKLGEAGIVDKAFAQTALKNMAGYRNRLTHFYADVTADEIYSILKMHLDDFDVFLEEVRNVMEHPDQFGFTIEN
ncbi:MAG: DUF86 domain-containing protein [Bacteroidetes bacterium]|nr:MAG: DUF86 domain-containing protein [Bacteroidota bacterium]